LATLASAYRHFVVPNSKAHGRDACRASYLTHLKPGGQAALTVDGETIWLDPGEANEGFACEHILYSLISRVRSHFLVHAGAVAAPDRRQGLILVADAANGKTTLVLELLRRGFGFLSDEMAALARADGRLNAFPRALRLRDDTLKRVGLEQAGDNAPIWLGKRLVDVDDLAPARLVNDADLAHVIVMSDAPGTPVPAQDELSFWLDRLEAGLLDEIRSLPGVARAEPVAGVRQAVIRVQAEHRMSVVAEVERLSRAAGVHVLDIVKRDEVPATFAGPASLAPLARADAVLELLRRFQGGHHSALLQQDFGGHSAGLFREVSRLISQAQCHRLTVGPLPAMADLVQSLVSN